MARGKLKINKLPTLLILAIFALCTGIFYLSGHFFPESYQVKDYAKASVIEVYKAPELDLVDYDRRMLRLANYGPEVATTSQVWPVEAPYPKVGAILPFKRIIAYYGNLYSTKMGVLGEYSEEEMFRRLKVELERWEQADPSTPVQPALDYIAVTAQGSAGADGKYRLRMPDSEIDKVLAMAKKIDAIVILEVQPGLANLQQEIEELEPYLKKPQVHLAIDPEFCMKNNRKPGEYIGTVDASEINEASAYLARLVSENNLPPKILIVHRFTQNMVTNASQIKTRPEVQIVIDMDGWGGAAKKIDSYEGFVASEPVQFTGFKLFYKNDFRQPGSRMMTPEEVLSLSPQPIFIQYQ